MAANTRDAVWTPAKGADGTLTIVLVRQVAVAVAAEETAFGVDFAAASKAERWRDELPEIAINRADKLR
jgi:hypothetical protein